MDKNQTIGNSYIIAKARPKLSKLRSNSSLQVSEDFCTWVNINIFLTGPVGPLLPIALNLVAQRLT